MTQIETVLQNRVDFYALLGRLYRREVDAALWEAVTALAAPEATGNERMDEGWRVLRGAVADLSTHADPIEDLAVDYARAFLGAGVPDGDAAFPFESVYTSPRRLVMQEAWEEVCRIYREAGLARKGDDLHEDQLGVELEFLEKLGRDALEAERAGNAEERDRLLAESAKFLTEHPQRWIARFGEDVRRMPIGDFYKGLSLLTEGFLAIDAELLAEGVAD